MNNSNTPITIEIYEIPHTQDGHAYDLGLAEVVNTIKTTRVSYLDDRVKALVLAGTHLDRFGGLIAIRDSMAETDEYWHWHGFTGELRRFTSISALRNHLRKNCRGMELIRSTSGLGKRERAILRKFDEWKKYAFAEDLDEQTVDKGNALAEELWKMVLPYMNEYQRKQFDAEWYGACNPTVLKEIIIKSMRCGL